MSAKIWSRRSESREKIAAFERLAAHSDGASYSVRETTRCSFAEVIEVTLFQIEDAGVSRFECPTCLPVREIKPKGERVKVPSHPRRMTTTPNQGSRWVKREIAWKLFDS